MRQMRVQEGRARIILNSLIKMAAGRAWNGAAEPDPAANKMGVRIKMAPKKQGRARYAEWRGKGKSYQGTALTTAQVFTNSGTMGGLSVEAR